MTTSPLDPVDTARLRAGGGVKWGLAASDVLPAWVADMDLGIPPAVRERLADVIRREDLGYPYWRDGDAVVAAFERRMLERFDWDPRAGRTRVRCDAAELGPLADVAASRTVTATSATKAFNIAGVACAVAHVGSDALWERLERLPGAYLGAPGVLGRAATVAAWAARHPSVLRLLAPEATYLAWIDFAGTSIAARPSGVILDRGRVMLNGGADFSRHTGVTTTALARLNFATDDVMLGGVLAGIDRALAGGG